MLLHRRALALALFLTILGVGLSSAPYRALSGQQCDPNPRRALAFYLGYNDNEIREMESRRSISLPRLNASDAVEFSHYVNEYLAPQKSGALMHFATEGDVLCGFLWIRGDREPRYFRTNDAVAKLRQLQGELGAALDVDATWRARSNAKVVTRKQQTITPRPTKTIVKEVSELLFPAAFTDGLRSVKQLSIIPVQNMSSLPVAALEPLSDGNATIDLFSVTFVAFARDLRKSSEPRARRYQRPEIFGNPRPSLDEQYLWQALPGAEQEVEVVHAAVGGTIHLREAATKRAFISAISNSDLVYFAGHGYTDASTSLENSFLVMADGRISAKEIQALRLREGPLVVLSACHTGEGWAMEAGVIGLARAFQIAGASNTIMSLWAIDDVATEEIMSLFIQLLKSHPPPEAMRQASIQMRNKNSNLAIWSAFNVFGNQTGNQ